MRGRCPSVCASLPTEFAGSNKAKILWPCWPGTQRSSAFPSPCLGILSYRTLFKLTYKSPLSSNSMCHIPFHIHLFTHSFDTYLPSAYFPPGPGLRGQHIMVHRPDTVTTLIELTDWLRESPKSPCSEGTIADWKEGSERKRYDSMSIYTELYEAHGN